MQQTRPKASHHESARSHRGRAVVGKRSRFTHLRRGWLLGALGLIGVITVVISMLDQPARSAAPAPEVGHLAPAIVLATPDGTTVSLADLRGQVVLVNFWATWCPPCREEMPAIQAAYERYRDQGFTVLAVTADENHAAVEQFLLANGLTFPALLDPAGTTHTTYLATALPSSFFIDREGIIRAIHRGPMTSEALDTHLRPLLTNP